MHIEQDTIDTSRLAEALSLSQANVRDLFSDGRFSNMVFSAQNPTWTVKVLNENVKIAPSILTGSKRPFDKKRFLEWLSTEDYWLVVDVSHVPRVDHIYLSGPEIWNAFSEFEKGVLTRREFYSALSQE